MFIYTYIYTKSMNPKLTQQLNTLGPFIIWIETGKFEQDQMLFIMICTVKPRP